MTDVKIDALGQACPMPVVRATRALGEMRQAGTLFVRVDNAAAVENLKRMAQGYVLPAQSTEDADGNFTVTIRVDTPVADIVLKPAETEDTGCEGGYVVAVDAATMGRGDDTLGHLLLRGFLYALTQQRVSPTTVLFYNGGAHWTVEGSEALEDLRSLESRGTAIMTCGTCLNHYGLTDKLAVGTITDMGHIAATLTGAEKVIKP